MDEDAIVKHGKGEDPKDKTNTKSSKEKVEEEQKLFVENKLLPQEGDVMQFKRLPTEYLKLNKETTEKLLCILTSPSLSIPLVLNFFSRDLLGTL